MMKSRKTPSNSNKHLPQISDYQYLPPEVWIQILARLPVKTLVRFRCVCKFWCSVIDQPDFTSMHRKLYKNNSSKNKILALQELGPGGFRGCLLTVRQADTLVTTSTIFQSFKTFRFLGSCNGLILAFRYTAPGELRFWNPSVRKSLLLPPCPLATTFNGQVDYVMGFAPSYNDYKILAIKVAGSHVTEPTEMSVAVYTLRDEDWRTVKSNDLNIACWYVQRLMWSSSSALFCEGAAHWLGGDPSRGGDHEFKPTHLVSLNFDTEKFTYLELDLSDALDETETSRLLFLLGDSLAILSVSLVSIYIWVLEKHMEKLSWTPWFSGHSSSDAFALFKSCRDTKVFYVETGGGCFICHKRCYNIATGQVQKLSKLTGHPSLEVYLESLVLHRGYGAHDLTSFP